MLAIFDLVKEIGREFTVPFIVYESDEKRDERNSVYALQRLLKKTLENTNWRLMSEGVRYRLGLLEGRLRAYEKEEDLVKLIKPEGKDKTARQ